MTNTQSVPIGVFFMLAWRNLWRHKRRTIITLSSIAIGFGLTVFSIGMQDSGHNNMVKNAINMGDGHITIQHSEYLASPANHRFLEEGKSLLQQVEAQSIKAQVVPRITLQTLASTANNSVGVAVQGINIKSDPLRDIIEDKIQDGRWLQQGDERGLIIGSGMARKLKTKVGGKVVIMAGKKGGDSEAQLGRVRGIFHSGMLELDNYFIVAGLDFTRRFLIAEGGKVENQPLTRVAIFLDDEKQLVNIKQQLNKAINQPNTVVLDWQQMLPQLVQYIVIDDVSAYVMQIFILLVIVFGIVNTVLMGVLERTREFGLLRALGFQKNYLVLLVFLESLLLSGMAVFFGWLVGGSIHLYVAAYGIDFSGLIPEGTTFAGTFMDPIIYSELSPARVYQLTSIVFLTTLASGIYPAIKASRVTPIEALRT